MIGRIYRRRRLLTGVRGLAVTEKGRFGGFQWDDVMREEG